MLSFFFVKWWLNKLDNFHNLNTFRRTATMWCLFFSLPICHHGLLFVFRLVECDKLTAVMIFKEIVWLNARVFIHYIFGVIWFTLNKLVFEFIFLNLIYIWFFIRLIDIIGLMFDFVLSSFHTFTCFLWNYIKLLFD